MCGQRVCACVCVENRSSLQVPPCDLLIKMALHSGLRSKQAVRSSHSIFYCGVNKHPYLPWTPWKLGVSPWWAWSCRRQQCTLWRALWQSQPRSLSARCFHIICIFDLTSLESDSLPCKTVWAVIWDVCWKNLRKLGGMLWRTTWKYNFLTF